MASDESTIGSATDAGATPGHLRFSIFTGGGAGQARNQLPRFPLASPKKEGLSLFPSKPFFSFGGANRDRTGDLYNAIVALSQLSYGPRIERGGEIRNIGARRQGENSPLHAGFSVSAPPPRRFRSPRPCRPRPRQARKRPRGVPHPPLRLLRSLRLPLPPRRPPHLRFQLRRRAHRNRLARAPSRPSGRGAHVAI